MWRSESVTCIIVNSDAGTHDATYDSSGGLATTAVLVSGSVIVVDGGMGKRRSAWELSTLIHDPFIRDPYWLNYISSPLPVNSESFISLGSKWCPPLSITAYKQTGNAYIICGTYMLWRHNPQLIACVDYKDCFSATQTFGDRHQSFSIHISLRSSECISRL